MPRNTGALHSRAHHPDARHFNEAEASLPRNTSAGQGHHERRHRTSMRPRQACLGIRVPCAANLAARRRHFNEAEASLPRNTPANARQTAPDRRDFNEAEASLPRNTTSPTPTLTRKKNYFNEAEASLPRNTHRVPNKIQTPALTSMRPRQACLGIHPTRRRGFSGLITSMRPRQACLGIPGRKSQEQVREDIRLQ